LDQAKEKDLNLNKTVPQEVIEEAAEAIIDAVQADANEIREALEKTHDRQELPVIEKEPLPDFNAPDEWTLMLVGQQKVYEHNFPTDDFNHPERIFWKAEQMEDTPKGTVNDVYYLYHLNKEKRIALYIKHP
jgi:hypothetical protein